MAKKRKEARNIMKFGKNVDLERKYFDQWKTKGTFMRLEIQGTSPIRITNSINLPKMNQNDFSFWSKKEEKAKADKDSR